MANARHLKTLPNGSAAWNAWRTVNPPCRPDLTGADLTRVVLQSVNLRDTNLSRAILREADLSGANLTNSRLAGADLRESVLAGAVLYGAALCNADLRGAFLRWADLSRAQLVQSVGSAVIAPAEKKIQQILDRRDELRGGLPVRKTAPTRRVRRQASR